jgi:hypothetical protein
MPALPIVIADRPACGRALLTIAERFHEVAGTRSMSLPVINQ